LRQIDCVTRRAGRRHVACVRQPAGLVPELELAMVMQNAPDKDDIDREDRDADRNRDGQL